VKAALARLMESRPALAWQRYTEARGNILAAGMGFFAFFSIFPAVALAFSVFGFVLREHPDLLKSVYDQLSRYLPGLVQEAGHPEGLIPRRAPQALTLTLTGVIAFVTLVLTGLGWLRAVREGIRAVFGAKGSGRNLVTNMVRDLGVLFSLGLGIALIAVLTSGVGAAAGWIAEGIGMSGHTWVLLIADFVVSVVADTALMIVLLRVVSGVKVPWRDLSGGALVGGVGFSLLKLSAAALLPRLTANPLFASFVVVVGLLVWLNLIARLTLISAAWAANDVDLARPGDLTVQPRVEGIPGQVPQTLAPARTEVVRDATMPTFGTRSLDRATLGSGLVLGAMAMAATGALVRGLRSVVRLGRG
jgi:membrane protein